MKKRGPPREFIAEGTLIGSSTYLHDVDHPGVRHASFVCSCGNKFIARVSHVKAGTTKGCGCRQGLNLVGIEPRRTHGFAGSDRASEYSIWNMMRSRCTNPKNKNFHQYGGRGIKVCDRWRKFENFIEDMGTRPSKKHSIDRINNNGNYEPLNCRWATKEEQSANRSDNRLIEHEGRVLPLFLWAKESGIRALVIHKRLKRGWSFSRSITQAVRM